MSLFSIKLLSLNDIDTLRKLQYKIINSLLDKESFYPLSLDELRQIITKTGFVVGLFSDNVLVGYATIIFVDLAPQLISVFNISSQNLFCTAILDDVAIAPNYRGHNFQLLLWNYIQQNFCTEIKYLKTSIYPYNLASLKNAKKFHMNIVNKKFLYENNLRFILEKKIK